jgi:ABC-2 type transporter
VLGKPRRISGSLEALPGELETVHGKPRAIPGSLAAVPGGLEALHGKLRILPAATEALHGELGALDGKSRAILGQLETVNGKPHALSGELRAIPGQLETINGRPSKIDVALGTIPVQLGGKLGKLGKIPGEIGAIFSKAATIPASPDMIHRQLVGEKRLGSEILVARERQRQRGLWKRLRSAPISPGLLLLGKAASSTVISLLTLGVSFGFAMAVFGIRIEGTWLGFIGVMLASALMAATLGLLIAALGNTPKAAVNAVPVGGWVATLTPWGLRGEGKSPVCQLLSCNESRDSCRK